MKLGCISRSPRVYFYNAVPCKWDDVIWNFCFYPTIMINISVAGVEENPSDTTLYLRSCSQMYLSIKKERNYLFTLETLYSDMHSRWRMITSTAFRENYQTTVCLCWGLFLRKSEHNPGAVFNLVLAWGSYSELRETLWFCRIIKPLNVKDEDIKRLKAKTSQFVSE